MKKKRYSEEQIVFALRQADSGVAVAEICRIMGVREATFYRWKKKFHGMGVAELRRLRQLEEENRKLKQLVADLSLDKQMLQDVVKKMVTPRRKRPMVEYLQDAYGVSTRRACGMLPMHRSTYRYQYKPDRYQALRVRMRDLAGTWIGWGYRRLRTLFEREGWSAKTWAS